MRPFSIVMIVMVLFTSGYSFGQSDLDEEARAKAEMQALEAAMAKEQKKTIVPIEVKTPAPAPVSPVIAVAPVVQPVVIAQPVPQQNNLSRFMANLPWGKQNTSTVYLSLTPYRMNMHFFERLGTEEGQVIKCPIKGHDVHFLDSRNWGLVLTDNRTKHVDLPPMPSLALEAREYVLSLTQRDNLEIHIWTRGYVITEAGTGLVLTVEIKD